MKKKIIWIAIALIIVSVAAFKLKSGGGAVDVESAKASKGDIVEYIEETGNVMLEEETIIYSSAAGKASKVYKQAGDSVKAGEILVEIDSDLQLQIKALKAQKLSASAKYAEVRNEADADEIRRLNAEVRAKEAAYEEAKGAAENNKALYDAGAVSLDTLRSSITKLAAAEASYEAAKSSLAAAEKGASQNVRNQYEAQLAELQARIEQLEKKAKETVVRAPIDGLVTASEVKEGNIVQMGSKLFEIGGSKGFYMESDVLMEDIAGVKLNSPVLIENEDLGINSMQGTVRKIYPKAFNKLSELGIEQKRVKVEITMDAVPDGLRPGYEMTVRIVTKSSKDTLLISEKSLFDYQGKPHIFVVENGTARLRNVEKGIESDELVEIIKGLNDGEEVILSPDETLKEGTKVK